MRRVMLIDDEKALRSLLKRIIPWEELQLEVAGEAESGVEAINTIDKIRPHIVFADIKMPFMNGLEFAELAKQRYPDLKVIILTAHEEFDYARQSIKIGVEDYLLKPINRNQVIETLKRIIDSLGPEKAEEEVEDEIAPGAMGQIQAFLTEAYQDSNMNLTSVAQKFGFHPSYLSRKFKEEVGQSLIDYLTAYRMEKACELALQGMLMYRTAEEVGIKDPNYFGRCFKKYKGISYSDYMKSLTEEEEVN